MDPDTTPMSGMISLPFTSRPSLTTSRSAKYPLPIYTLAMLNGRTYAVNSPDLVAAVQRSPKIFAFNPFVVEVSQRLCGCSKSAIETLCENLEDVGLMNETKRDMHTALAPGPNLDMMNETMIKNVGALLSELDAELAAVGDEGKELELHAWARHVITMASTDATYGVENPFSKDRRVEDAFWYVRFHCRFTAPSCHGQN